MFNLFRWNYTSVTQSRVWYTSTVNIFVTPNFRFLNHCEFFGCFQNIQVTFLTLTDLVTYIFHLNYILSYFLLCDFPILFLLINNIYLVLYFTSYFFLPCIFKIKLQPFPCCLLFFRYAYFLFIYYL